MSVPSHMAAAYNAIMAYNWFPISNNPNETIRAMKDTIVDNLVWLYNLTPEHIRNRAKLWYKGANRIAKDWTTDISLQHSSNGGCSCCFKPAKRLVYEHIFGRACSACLHTATK
jgi:hypothetical protein